VTRSESREAIVLIATGSTPHRSCDIPFDDKFIFDSDSILEMEHIPKSMVAISQRRLE